MNHTFVPKHKHAKLYARNRRISTKSAVKLCAVIRKKPLTRVKRLLTDLAAENRSLGGKHYTKTAREMLSLLESCEKNATFLGLDTGRLMVHASAHKGMALRRRRRKAAYGSRMKSTNVEIVLLEKGKERKKPEKRPAKKGDKDMKKAGGKKPEKEASEAKEKPAEEKTETGAEKTGREQE